MSGPRFKVAFCWWPRRLAVHAEDRMWFVGWVWLKQAYLVNNINHGWIAFVHDQTEEQMARCPSCKRLLNEHAPQRPLSEDGGESTAQSSAVACPTDKEK